MKPAHKVMIAAGAIFAVVGSFITIAFFANREEFGLWAYGPLFFVALGIGLIIPGLIGAKKNRDIVKFGRKYPAKICGYVKDRYVEINGYPAINTLVRYFDEYRRVKECVIETGFQIGSNKYPIGMTMDIYELDGNTGWDKDSVRQEKLFDESALMDGATASDDDEVTAIQCENCGAPFVAVKSCLDKCPYCKSPLRQRDGSPVSKN